MKKVNCAEALKLVKERIARNECPFCGKLIILTEAIDFFEKSISKGSIKICNTHHISSKQ